MEDITTHGNKKETYDDFVNKFKTKKTTDDCYTPPETYAVIKKWVIAKFDIPSDAEIIRPFYPGGDYKQVEYPKGCVVIDNPPFSKLKEICNYYNDRNIKYILLCHAQTIMCKKYAMGICFIRTSIIYNNGAEIATAITHNYYDAIETAPDLDKAIRNIQKDKERLPKYTYPDNIITASKMRQMSGGGEYFRIDNFKKIRRLDCQKESDKEIYGGGVIVSDAKAEEAVSKIKAARKRIEKTPIVWEFSKREKEIIDKLNNAESE